MKKLLSLIILLALIVTLAGCTEDGRWAGLDVKGDVTIDGDVSIDGDLSVTGDVVIDGTLTVGGVPIPIMPSAASMIETVQTYINGVTENDTATLVFTFEPSVIVLSYSAICHHENFPFEVGHTTGHSVINVRAVDTITIDTNYTAIKDDDGTMDSAILHSNTDVLMAAGGYDGLTYAKCWGIGTWETATHTLTVKFDDVKNTWEAANFFEIVAMAYE